MTLKLAYLYGEIKSWDFAVRVGLAGKDLPWGYDENLVVMMPITLVAGANKWEYTAAPVGSFKPKT